MIVAAMVQTTASLSIVIASLILPPAFETGRRQFGVPNRVLYILVAEVSLQRSGVPSGVRLVKATRVPKHVRMNREINLGGNPQPRDQFAEACGGEWGTTF